MRILHRLAHWLGWNCGTVTTWWDGSRLMVGFRCNCGKVSSIHESPRLRARRFAVELSERVAGDGRPFPGDGEWFADGDGDMWHINPAGHVSYYPATFGGATGMCSLSAELLRNGEDQGGPKEISQKLAREMWWELISGKLGGTVSA